MPGTLFLVSTPIGNLEDITLRALRVLKEAAVIAAEDTRRTRGLLVHHSIGTPTLSLHEHNERDRLPLLLARLRAGEDVALVTDAGTPLVSDPGADLVQAARAEGITVVAVPGPSALLTALVGSGLPAETFTFLGFPPSRAGERLRWLQALAAEPRTTIFFEAPHRIEATLRDLGVLVPDRRIAVGRELTKLHEQVLTGPAAQVLAELGPPRGEFTVVVSGPAEVQAAPDLPDSATLWREFCSLTGEAQASRRDAVTALARRYARPAREIYAAIERARQAGASDH